MTDQAKAITLTQPATIPYRGTSYGAVSGTPKLLLRVEAAAVVVLAVIFYSKVGESFSWFAMLFFTPDLSMAGYLAGRHTGAAFYNGAHSYIAPALILGIAYITNYHLGLSIALIWFAHIGLDRMLGFGLKYSTGFTDTHLGRIGGGLRDNLRWGRS